MRQDLKRWKRTCHTFVAKVGPVNREGRQVLRNVQLLRDDGKVIGGCEHINTSKKPFKQIKKGALVKFSGSIFEYKRQDGTTDYSVKVNKAKKIDQGAYA